MKRADFVKSVAVMLGVPVIVDPVEDEWHDDGIDELYSDTHGVARDMYDHRVLRSFVFREFLAAIGRGVRVGPHAVASMAVGDAYALDDTLSAQAVRTLATQVDGVQHGPQILEPYTLVSCPPVSLIWGATDTELAGFVTLGVADEGDEIPVAFHVVPSGPMWIHTGTTLRIESMRLTLGG